MNDLKTVRDALDIAAYQCEFIPKKMEVINKAYQELDRMIETPAVQAGDVMILRKALLEATSILEGAGYLVQVAEYKDILEDTE